MSEPAEGHLLPLHVPPRPPVLIVILRKNLRQFAELPYGSLWICHWIRVWNHRRNSHSRRRNSGKILFAIICSPSISALTGAPINLILVSFFRLFQKIDKCPFSKAFSMSAILWLNFRPWLTAQLISVDSIFYPFFWEFIVLEPSQMFKTLLIFYFNLLYLSVSFGILTNLPIPVSFGLLNFTLLLYLLLWNKLKHIKLLVSLLVSHRFESIILWSETGILWVQLWTASRFVKT